MRLDGMRGDGKRGVGLGVERGVKLIVKEGIYKKEFVYLLVQGREGNWDWNIRYLLGWGMELKEL